MAIFNRLTTHDILLVMYCNYVYIFCCFRHIMTQYVKITN